MFGFLIWKHLSIFFSWNKIYIKDSRKKDPFELFLSIKQQYAMGCINYNRNTQLVKDDLYFVTQARELVKLEMEERMVSRHQAIVVTGDVDTFKIHGRYIYALNELGFLSKLKVSDHSNLKRRRLGSIKSLSEKYFTTLGVGKRHLMVASMFKSIEKKTTNQVLLFDTSLKQLDVLTLAGSSLKFSRLY